MDINPREHLGYSNDYRPDVSVAGAGRSRSRLVGDVKFKDSLSSNPEDVGQRGAFVGLGNTEPGTSADVFGLEQRGAVGDGDFRPSDGGGYVAYKKADYAHALSRSDTDVQMYLFETFGGWCNAVKRLFYQMKDKVRNKLSKRQHEDEATCVSASARQSRAPCRSTEFGTNKGSAWVQWSTFRVDSPTHRCRHRWHPTRHRSNRTLRTLGTNTHTRRRDPCARI